MIRKVALAAMTLLAAGAASAQSSVSIYGVLDASVGSFQTSYDDAVANSNTRRTAVESGVMTTSFIGFKGVEDLGNGLKGTFMLESFLRTDVGDAGRSDNDTFWARNANIGLAGDFGAVSVGRMDTLLFLSSLAFNPFGGSFGVSPTIRQTFGAGVGLVLGDSGWGNTIKYVTPNLNGFTAAVQYQLKETTGTDNGNSWAANVTYLAGPFGVSATYQNFKTASTANNPGATVNGNTVTPADTALQGFANLPNTFTFGDEQTLWQLGASYDFGGAKLFGQYTDATTEYAAGGRDLDAKQWQVGVSVPLGAGALLASYGQVKFEQGADEGKNKIFTLGYDYNLSKRTDVYAAYMYDKNSDNDPATDWKAGNTFAVGVRHRF